MKTQVNQASSTSKKQLMQANDAIAAGTSSFKTAKLLSANGLAPSNLTLADILGVTGGNTVPLVDRLVEVHGLANVPASVDGVPETDDSTVPRWTVAPADHSSMSTPDLREPRLFAGPLCQAVVRHTPLSNY